jgi:flagellar M-ring protein FliF
MENTDQKKKEDFLSRVSKQMDEFLKSLSLQKKIAMVGVFTGIMAAMVLLFSWAGSRTYSPFMSNLNGEDSTNVIRYLKDKNIPFRVENGGRQISVSTENMDVLRMELAIGGLPQTSTVGYEVFDKQSLGTPSFVQKVNQKRALEGELIRTINSIHGVKRSRVHLAMPQKTAFVEDQKRSSASVVLDLESGVTLNEKQIYGISNLVARAVEGLDVSDVVIVDSLGKTLSKNSADSLSQMATTQLDYKTKMENDLENRVESILSRIVGEGHVVARVSADLDYSAVSETQTTYDQDGAAVRSRQTSDVSQEGNRPVASGVPGAQSNTPVTAGQGTGPNSVKISDVKNKNEVTNYDIPQTVKKTTRSPGSVKKMSVAVVVDGQVTKTKNADGTFASKVEPWSPEKIKEFEQIIANAVGLDRKRGDTIEVKTMEFKQTDFQEIEAMLAEKERKEYVKTLVAYFAIALTIILFFFTVVRPFIQWVTENTTDGVETFLPQTLEELEKASNGSLLPGMEDAMPTMADQIDPEKIESEMVKEKIVALIDANPQKAALILRDWVLGNAQGKRKDEDGGEGTNDGEEDEISSA